MFPPPVVVAPTTTLSKTASGRRIRCLAALAAAGGSAALLLYSGADIDYFSSTAEVGGQLRQLGGTVSKSPPTSGSGGGDVMLSNLADVSFAPPSARAGGQSEAEDEEEGTPAFWHIYKSGGTTMKDVLIRCVDVAIAADIGGGNKEKKLRVIKKPASGFSYVNVDTSNGVGIERASRLGLAESHLAGVIVSPQINKLVADVFSPVHRGRMFALFRHPVDRLVSQYYYLQHATWESTYNPDIGRKWSLGQYARIYGDRMMQQMLGYPGKMTEGDFERAKEIVRTKVVVGLVSETEESVRRFVRYFGWETDETDTCIGGYFSKQGGKNSNKHPPVEEGSDVWNEIARAMPWDMKLYEYALTVYEEQGRQLGLDAAVSSGEVATVS